jgi:hypothetical protein
MIRAPSLYSAHVSANILDTVSSGVSVSVSMAVSFRAFRASSYIGVAARSKPSRSWKEEMRCERYDDDTGRGVARVSAISRNPFASRTWRSCQQRVRWHGYSEKVACPSRRDIAHLSYFGTVDPPS